MKVRYAMSQKLVAVVLAGLFVATAASNAWAHCAGWLPSPADRHACCRGEMVSESRATACCAMSEQSDDTAPTEARVATPPLTLIRHLAPARVLLPVPLAVRAIPSADLAGVPTSVPLYLRQAALLI